MKRRVKRAIKRVSDYLCCLYIGTCIGFFIDFLDQQAKLHSSPGGFWDNYFKSYIPKPTSLLTILFWSAVTVAMLFLYVYRTNCDIKNDKIRLVKVEMSYKRQLRRQRRNIQELKSLPEVRAHFQKKYVEQALAALKQEEKPANPV